MGATLLGVERTLLPLSLRLVRLEEAAAREGQRSNLALEARRLSKDPAYVKEAREIVAEFEDLRASW